MRWFDILNIKMMLIGIGDR